MKTYINKILCITFIGLFSFPANAMDETTKIESFCKVWGFLKYYHPAVANGTIDWDNEFMIRMDKLVELDTRQDINSFYQ